MWSLNRSKCNDLISVLKIPGGYLWFQQGLCFLLLSSILSSEWHFYGGFIDDVKKKKKKDLSLQKIMSEVSKHQNVAMRDVPYAGLPWPGQETQRLYITKQVPKGFGAGKQAKKKKKKSWKRKEDQRTHDYEPRRRNDDLCENKLKMYKIPQGDKLNQWHQSWEK